MKYKHVIMLLPILMACSLFSIGFASWNISGGYEEEIYGSLATDKVVKLDNCLKLDLEKGTNNSGIEWFNYEKIGYLNSNSTKYVDTGHIITYFNIDLDACKSYFNEKNSLKLTFTLGYGKNVNTSFNIFSNHSNLDGNRVSPTCVVSSTFNELNIEKSEDIIGKSIVVEINLNDILLNYVQGSQVTYDLTLDFQFYATTGVYFYNNIYYYLKNQNISFEIDVSISDI